MTNPIRYNKLRHIRRRLGRYLNGYLYKAKLLLVAIARPHLQRVFPTPVFSVCVAMARAPHQASTLFSQPYVFETLQRG